jgi:hypothetical protein
MIVALGNKNRLSEGAPREQFLAFSALAKDPTFEVYIRVGSSPSKTNVLMTHGTSRGDGYNHEWRDPPAEVTFGFSSAAIKAFYNSKGVIMKDASGITSHHFIGVQLKSGLYVAIQFS